MFTSLIHLSQSVASVSLPVCRGETGRKAMTERATKKPNAWAAERRPSPRKSVLLTGIVALESGQRSFDCTIRDLSQSGARIVAPPNARLPDSFYLINIRDRIAYQAKLVHSDANGAGVCFQKTLPLSLLTDPALTFLKRLWLSKASR